MIASLSEREIPTNANVGLCFLDDLASRMRESKLCTQNITNANLNDQELKDLAAELVKIAEEFQEQLCPIYRHLNLLLYQKTVKRVDTGGIASLMGDIDAVMQKLTSMTFDLGEFYQKHQFSQDLQKNASGAAYFRKGHKMWIGYYVHFILSNLESIPRFYRLLTQT